MYNFSINALLKIVGNHRSTRMDRYGGTVIVAPSPGMENVLQGVLKDVHFQK